MQRYVGQNRKARKQKARNVLLRNISRYDLLVLVHLLAACCPSFIFQQLLISFAIRTIPTLGCPQMQ